MGVLIYIVAEHLHPRAPEAKKTGERVPEVKGFEGSSQKYVKLLVKQLKFYSTRHVSKTKWPKSLEKPKFGVGKVVLNP